MGSLKIRNYLSIYHILAAAYFARQCLKIELRKDEVSQKYDDNSAIEHRALVMACIASSVSFIETTINELFVDAADTQHKSAHIRQLDNETQELLACLWEVESYGRTASILDKYQAALRLGKKPMFEKGKKPFQDVKVLIDLRNALVHFKPEWVIANTGGVAEKDLHVLENKLKKKFTLNPFLKDKRPLFPTLCMSHGCAKWAVDSAVIFVERFYAEMRMTNPLDTIRESLRTQ
jgi:hypothetical protein